MTVAQLVNMQKKMCVACVTFLLDSLDLGDLSVPLLSPVRVQHLARENGHRVIFAPPPGDIWQYLEVFFLGSWGGG